MTVIYGTYGALLTITIPVSESLMFIVTADTMRGQQRRGKCSELSLTNSSVYCILLLILLRVHCLRHGNRESSHHI